MVATIHRDPFEILIRKIGYSVGLESTLSRVVDLGRAYGQEGAISSGLMSTLLERWNLQSENIIDLFGSLDLIERQNYALFVLPTLDALGVLSRLVPTDAYEMAVRLPLLNSILAADGDIFLNCLSVDFEKEPSRRQLLRMIEYKRSRAKEAINSPLQHRKVDRFINIEAQRSNRGSKAGTGLASLKRTEPLDQTTGPLATGPSSEPKISDDYLRKVPARRRDWAKSLNLADKEGRRTDAGRSLLKLFDSLGQKTEDGAYAFWPFEHELSRLHLQPERVPWVTPDAMEVIYGIRACIAGNRFEPNPKLDPIEWARRIFDVYKKLNPDRSMVRVEVPLKTAMLVTVGYSCVFPAERYPLHEALAAADPDHREIEFRPSRQHEGSMVVRPR